MPRRVRTDDRAWKVIAYLGSLGGGGEPPHGDPVRGRQLFFGAGNCSTCHMVGGEGSLQGPDLTLIGWQRSVDDLRTSLLDPNADLDPRWWSAQVTTTEGIRVSGYLLDDDLHAVRLLDINNNLLAFPKAQLEQFEPDKTSRMPSYEDLLDGDDIDNVLAYLASLRGGGSMPDSPGGEAEGQAGGPGEAAGSIGASFGIDLGSFARRSGIGRERSRDRD